MKKLFSLIFAVVLGVALAMNMSSISAVKFNDARATLGIRDERILDFVEGCVLANEQQFVYERTHAYDLSDQFDREHNVYSMRFSEAKRVHADEINRLLRDGGNISYNGRILSDWAFCELRRRGVDCKEITVGWGEPLCMSTLVIIPQFVNGVKQWYVCDLISMFKHMARGNSRYRKFLFFSLKDYINLYGDIFRGAVVNDEEYSGYRDGVGLVSGRDIFCWLSTDGESLYTAGDMLVNRITTDTLRFMTSFPHLIEDERVFARLIEFFNLTGVPVRAVLLS